MKDHVESSHLTKFDAFRVNRDQVTDLETWFKVKPSSQGWLIAAGAYPGFCSMKRLEVFLLPLDGMLVHRRSLPCNFVRFPPQITGTHLYTWVERGTARVKCLAQEHNTLSQARARTRTARSGVERTNHEATAPPTKHGSKSIQTSLMLKQRPPKPYKLLNFFYQFYDNCKILSFTYHLKQAEIKITYVYPFLRVSQKS